MLISSWLTSVRNRLQNSPRNVKRRVVLDRAARSAEHLEARALLTSLEAVRPNIGAFLFDGETRNVAPQELTLQFSLGEPIDAGSVNSNSIQVERSGHDGIFGNGNDVPVTVGYVGIGNAINEVILRFGENLPNDSYRITVKGTGADILTSSNGVPFNGGVDESFSFNLDLGAQVVAVDPQPVTVNANGTVTQARNQIVVYFNEDDLDPVAAQNPLFYQLIHTRETVSNTDDLQFNPSGVVYDSALNKATLTFASDLHLLGAGAGTFRLRIGNAEAAPVAPTTVNPAADPGDSFATSTNIGNFAGGVNSSQILVENISAQPYVDALGNNFVFPGGETDPGNRQIELQKHLLQLADTTNGISQIDYNFKSAYGTDPLGSTLLNVITPAQRDRAREVFEYYGELLGIDFRETDDSGLTIVTGDMRALLENVSTGAGGPVGIAGSNPFKATFNTAIMDMAENWDDTPGGNWFATAMREIGHLLGLGDTFEQPLLTVMGSNPNATSGTVEPDFPGDIDIVHGQHLYRPDSIDIDLYSFTVAANQTGTFSAEVIAERLASASRLDSVIRLYRQNPDGTRELIAQNDDYFSEDSFLQVPLSGGTAGTQYFIGISASGNAAYDPTIAGTGTGGTSQGAYQLRVDFRPNETSTIVDTTGVKFDGNSDGVAGGVYNFWFRAAAPADTIFVNKAAVTVNTNALSGNVNDTAVIVQSVASLAVNDVIRIDNEHMRITAINVGTRTLTVTRAVNGTVLAAHNANSIVRNVAANGTEARPFGVISDALAVATPGRIVRLVGNGGADGDVTTINDNLPYQIGFNSLNQPLPDGTTLEVPRGVTLMIDQGAVMKLRRALIGVGSSSTSVDRSAGSLQVLGVPGNNVIFTSWSDETIGTDTSPTPTTAQPGDWGGLAFRATVDRAQARPNYQNEGIFLNYVAQADLRYGGGNVVVDSVLQTINAIYIDGAQPTVAFNTITRSADSAMSANPDSFEELTFHSPRFQGGAAAFTSDYKRVGPDIHGNTLLNNSTNGLFVRVVTPAGNLTEKLTVSSRFDDTDIVHVIAQNLEIQGTPGGPVLDQTPPAVGLITATPGVGGTLAAGLYNYRIAFTDENGFEGPTSNVTVSATVLANGTINLQSLPPASGSYFGRRLYRSSVGGGGAYTLVAQLDKSATSYLDTGVSLGRTLTVVGTRDRARTDARLSIDPGIVVKLEGARIEAEMGSQFIAEGLEGRPIVFTSRLDDRFGAGGTFDTNNDDNAPTEAVPAPGNWGGIYIGHLGSASIDEAQISYAGGVIPVGSNFAGFNAIEIHQAEARIRNTLLELNGVGTGGTAPADRSGLFSNGSGTIFVRGAQPVILDNQFRSNLGPAININANALNSRLLPDYGRTTGGIDRQLAYADNQGPLVRDNRFGQNAINGMQVRGETLTTQGVWDDTDIVHVLFDDIYVPDFQHYGGLRLESSPTTSLVIKLQGANAGFTASGYPLDIVDRIGGSLQIIGQPGQPVVMTSLADDSVGAGFDLAGVPLRDTNFGQGNVAASRGQWRGVRLLQYAHDRNVKTYVENEQADRLSQDTNGTTQMAETLGLLAANQKSGDETLRLGFEVHGVIDSPADTDIYSFEGTAGTAVWIDIDRTTKSLDTVVELLDANGQLIAYSDNNNAAVSVDPNTRSATMPYSVFDGRDLYTLNQNDAGFRLILPGTAGTNQSYFVRVRSRAAGGDPTVIGGLTTGVYQLQVRLQELDEFPGSQVTYADIRYAVTGVDVQGLPIHSPLTGESTETEGNGTGVTSVTVGNLMNSDRGALSMAGRLGTPVGNTYDVDLWQFEVRYDGLRTDLNYDPTNPLENPPRTVFGNPIGAPHIPVTIDLDFADGFSRADVTIAVFDSSDRLILIGRDSNVSDDQPKPLDGSDVDDLSRGTNGKQDPFIGPVELIAGTYRLAVFPNDVVPQAMNQYWQANPTSSLVRFEPIDSVRRISEERFDNFDPLNEPNSTATEALVDLFTLNVDGTLNAKHAVPFHLGDVTLFVSEARGITGTNRTVISTVDAFTGAFETVLGQFTPPTGDIAMRADGQLHSFSLGPDTGAFTDGNVGNYLRIDTGTAAITNIGDDGIATNLLDGTAATAHDVGIGFNAMAYSAATGNSLWAIGNRSQLGPKPGQTGAVAAQFTSNILYQFNAATGDQINRGGGADRQSPGSATTGAGTTQTEIGQFDTTLGGGLGGTIRGMAFNPLNTTQLFAVDSLGGLYSATVTANGISGINFIGNVGGLGINFAGLTFGPDEVENQAYRTTLFGISTGGRLHAFNTAGTLQPIFNNAQTSVQISSVNNVTGIAFGTLDYNLWHTTTNRGGTTAADDGHGIDVSPYDNSVGLPVYGNGSLYFGNERQGTSAGNKNTDANNAANGTRIRDVNFPGGAHGTVVSNEFSLEGYSADDKPVLYFNYFLETEGAAFQYASPNILMRDSFRVFVADETNDWSLVSTSDSFQVSNQFDEFDYAPGFDPNTFSPTTGAPTTQTFVDVVETFDNTGGWRQARIDLSNFAGRAGLKLRFDFSTAGSMNLGNIQTTGSELYAVPGTELSDGMTFTIGGTTFEFEMGAHLAIPSSGNLEGQTFTVQGNTYKFTANPALATDILAQAGDRPQTLAQRAAVAVNGQIANSAVVTSNRITFRNAATVTLPGGSPLSTSGGTGTGINVPVPINANDSANAVAISMRQSIANVFAAGNISIIKGHENLIQVIGQTVTLPPGSPLPFVNFLPGDDFGAFTAGFQNGVANRPGSLRGMANAVEGVYVDDIIIGFAERGEMVTNAPATTAFIANNDLYNPNGPLGQFYLGISEGAYDVEIRRASDFGKSQIPTFGNLTNLLKRAIDTNDREVRGFSFTAPTADQIPHNSTFVVSDGWRSVTFQFIDQAIGLGALLPGNIPILYNPLTAMGGTYQDNQELISTLMHNAINSQAAQDVLRTQAVYSDNTGTTSRTQQLTDNGTITLGPGLVGIVGVTQYTTYGDSNHFRDQGQLIIQSSTVSNSQLFGINVDAGVRGGLNPTPHPGSVKTTQQENTARLVTGVVIMNNVIASNLAGGVRFSGDNNNNPQGVVPYGRIFNNTIVGTGAGIGIDVNESASPTLLNNIVADFTTGILVDPSSQAAGTTIGATLYRGNGTPSSAGALGDGTFPILLGAADALFVDQSIGNYYLAPFSQAIDSALNSLGDRPNITTVKSPLGLGVSPIVAPQTDVYGQLRGDDDKVATPAGQGANVFIDRGAIDRVDFFTPTAILSLPEDQSIIDLDGDVNEVWYNEKDLLLQFRVRLVDEGIGIDDAVDPVTKISNVNKSQFILQKDGVDLTEGVDYTFSYNNVSNEAIFTSVTFYEPERRYTIIIDNDDATVDSDGVKGVRDLAGNFLLANQVDGSAKFKILVTDGVNDPPINAGPGLAAQQVNEDTDLIFSSTANPKTDITVSDADVHLGDPGDNMLRVTLTATNGVLTLGGLTGLTFINGDGTADATMTFDGVPADINAALDGLKFRATQDYFGPATVTILTDDLGRKAGPGVAAEQDMDIINITVNSVNDQPTLNPVANPAAVNEDAGAQTVNGFVTGMSAGPANEPQALTAEITVQSTTGAWNTSNFFAPGGAPAINTATGALTYTPDAQVNGTATVQLILRDSDGLGSTPQTFVITVNSVNDEPIYTTTPAAGTISSLEDATGVQTVVVIATSSPGPVAALDEAAQSVNWTPVTPVAINVISGNLEFDLLEITPAGLLRYTPKKDTAGVVEFSVELVDSGSNVAPNDNTSAVLKLMITVTQVNDPPVAVTQNYFVDESYNLTLDASGSFDVDAFFGDTITYEWDLNGDGIYETPTGGTAMTTVTWAYLQSIGITAPQVYNISLKVTDAFGPVSGTQSATLTTQIVDYGDAPNTYGTTQAVNGAAHTINSTLFLGTFIDKETTGVPTVDATGDDIAGTDDEDGVLFPTSIESSPTLNLPAYVTVTSSAAGKLDVWLDLNQNGVFDHATEHLNGGTSFDVVAGSNRIEFLVPAGTAIGDTFMRFRLSSGGGLQPTGRTGNGEVEDYAVKVRTLQAPVTPTIIKPVDAVPGDGIAPETSDLTPLIEWTQFSSNYFYDVEVRDAANTVVFSLNNTIDIAVPVSNTLPAGNYTAFVTAKNKAGTAAATTSYQFTVVPLIVASPSGNLATHRPTVTWNPVAGSKNYRVEILSLASNTVIYSTDIAADPLIPPAGPLSHDVPVDLGIGQYSVRVQATDAADLKGDWSPASQFFVKARTTVTAPAATVTVPRPTVMWNAVPGAVSYQVQIDNATDNIRPVYNVTGITALEWTPPADLKLAQYTVWVRAFNAQGEANFWSTAVDFNVAPAPVATTPLVRLDDATPTFGWQALNGAERYELVVWKKWGDFAQVINQTGITTTSFTQPTDLPLGPYTWQIRGFNDSFKSGGDAAASSWSQVYEFTNAASPKITAPPTTTFSNNPTVTWVNPLGAGKSDIWVQQVGGDQQFLRIFQVSGTSYTMNEKVFGIGDYIVWVSSWSDTDNPATPVDERIQSFWGRQTFRVSTPPVVLGPTGQTQDATPTLTWQSVPGGNSYEIWIDNNSAPATRIYNPAGLNALSYTVPSDLPIGRYSYWVRAKNAFGVNSNWSTKADFEVVAAPVLTGPPSTTFVTSPVFTWNNMSTTLKGVPAGADTYEFQLEMLNTATQQYTVMAGYPKTGLTGTTFTVTPGLAAGTYRATVRARENGRPGAGVPATVSAYSQPVVFAVGGRPTVVPMTPTANKTPTINWSTVGGASGYEIFISRTATPNTPLIQQSNIGTTSYTVTTPLTAGTYRVWVRAINASNAVPGAWSVPVDFQIVERSESPTESLDPSEIRYTAVVSESAMQDGMTETTVSMLPAMVVEAAEWQDSAAAAVLERETRPAAVTSEPATPFDAAVPAPADSGELQETDSVLAGWDQQSWWDQSVAQTAVAEPAEPVKSPEQTAGILGALMALTPWALRRRRRDEQ